MPTRRKHSPQRSTIPLLASLTSKLQAPLGVVLGSPREAAEALVASAAVDGICWQMDLYQSERLKEELARHPWKANVVTSPDLWDLPQPMRTLIYPVAKGGERSLKLDMIEQAYHALAPHGHLIVLSPYEQDSVLPTALKKVFDRVHVPADTGQSVFWCRRDGERTRRRHEMTFQVRANETLSLRFLSRPGVFSYGRFDHGSRALLESAEIAPGDRVADLGCGCGANGVLASQRCGGTGSIAFVDSNLRALALTELNARAQCTAPFQIFATHNVSGLAERSFDVVLANPPYFAQLSIARLFIERGKVLLKPGGRFYLVTKMLDEVAGLMHEVFGEADVLERRGYFVFQALSG